MSKLKARLKRLEDALIGAASCAGCVPRPITLHHEYDLPDGETVILPPIPNLPPCTCKKRKGKIAFIVIRNPDQVSNREIAERQYAEYANRTKTMD